MNSLIKNNQYKDIINQGMEDVMTLMIDLEQDFLIVCETIHIDFNPELPENIVENFNDSVIFNIVGYTFETAIIDDENKTFSFSAGFGQENFASTITIPLLGIKQIFIGDDIVFVNFADPKEIVEDKSMSALMNNPENMRFIKKK
jgi:hypothetical protein